MVVGRTGSGKTTWAKQSLIDGVNRLLIFDPQAEYNFPRGDTAAAVKGLILGQIKRGGRIAVSYAPVSDHVRALHNFALLAWALGSCMVVIDEASLSLPVGSLPKDAQGALRLLLQGRHRGVSVVGITQRPALVSMNLRANVNRVVVFRLMSPRDVDAVSDMIGQRLAPEVATLQPFEYLDWDGDTVARKKLLKP